MPPQHLNSTLIIGALIRKLVLLHTMFVVLADQCIYVFQHLNSKGIISNNPTFTAICYNGKTIALRIQAPVLWQSRVLRTEIYFRKVIC